MPSMRILGVDPGSRLTGYGCIDLVGGQIRLVSHGTLRLANTSGIALIPLPDRLLSLYRGLNEVILKHQPQVLAIEKMFFAKNVVSAIKLGQARGAALLTGAIHSLEIAEYNPTEVKASLAGYGRADKKQIARVIELLLGRQQFTTPDASDALALAIHHAYCAFGKSRSSPLRSSHTRKKAFSLAESVKHRVEASPGEGHKK